MSITKEKLIGFIGSTVTCLIILLTLSLIFLKKKRICQEEWILINTGEESWIKELVVSKSSKLGKESNLNQKIQKNKISLPFEEAPVITQKDEQTTAMESSQKKKGKKKIELIDRQISGIFGEKGISYNKREKDANFSDLSKVASGSYSISREYNSYNVDLQGRSLRSSLQRPSYEGQEEGSIVVEIIVDQQGNVILAEVCLKGTNIENPNMRHSAVEAAKKTKFNAIERGQNQAGIITYKYILK